MKKALTLLVAMLFVVVAVGAAFAAETTFNGQYRVRAWTNWNFDKKPNDDASEQGRYDGYFDQRFRLTITHTRSEFLKAVVQIDLVEDIWGQQRNFLINDNQDGEFVNAAYIDFTLPKIGTFRVGKQPVVLGYGLAFSDSSGNLDGLKWSNKWGMVGVSAMYFKMYDRVSAGGASFNYNRDGDLMALDLMITPNENHTIELFGGLYLSRDGSFYNHEYSSNNDNYAKIGFLGLAYTGEFADMITVKSEISGIIGYQKYLSGPNNSHDIRGLNIYVDASYHNDLLRAGVAFIWGSGGEDNKDYENMNFILADEFVFGNIIASGSGGAMDNWGGGLGMSDDIENLTAVKLYFDITPLCCDGKLSLNAAVIWAQWTEPVACDGYYEHPSEYMSTHHNSWYSVANGLGWEIDLGMKYQIMEGLSYSLAAGVLFTGDSFDYDSGGHQEWGPIWTVKNELLYEF